MSRTFFLCCLFFAAMLIMSGCAAVPVSVPVNYNYSLGESERNDLISAFKNMLARQRDCSSCVEANVVLTFKSWLASGAVSGFLQAMSPSYIKFVAVSPLGQPLMLLSTDGDQFHYIDVGQAKIYEGPVKTEAFSNYAPKGFKPEFGYYWLIGRLWPGEVAITSVSRDNDRRGYWVEFAPGSSDMRSRVLFDPDHMVLLRHDLFAGDGKPLTSISYTNHSQGICPLPGRISVESSTQNGMLTLVMAWNETSQNFVDQDFEIDLPSGFQRIFVK